MKNIIVIIAFISSLVIATTSSLSFQYYDGGIDLTVSEANLRYNSWLNKPDQFYNRKLFA